MWIEINILHCFFPILDVTPYAGVWIEISKVMLPLWSCRVTPYAGVWIEIVRISSSYDTLMSLPTRECGLKSAFSDVIATYVGHSLRGSVD